MTWPRSRGMIYYMSETDILISKLTKLRKKKIKSVEVIKKKDLRDEAGRKLDGWAHFDINEILIEEKLGAFCYLETVIHELMHLLYPTAKEKTITEKSEMIARLLWQLNFRQTKGTGDRVKIKFK